MAVKTWLITQTRGDRNQFRLAGRFAPHGRPRRAPVVVEEEKLRQQKTYYANKPQPTRHIFGTKHEPWKLKGRFQDFVLGRGGALQKKRELQSFFREMMPVLVCWGDIVAYEGILEGIKFNIEAEYDIEYEINIDVDMDVSHSTQKDFIEFRHPGDITMTAQLQMLLLQQTLAGLKPDGLPNLYAMSLGFLDKLESVVALALTPFSTIVDITSQISSITKAVDGDLKRLEAGCMQAQTAFLNLRDTIESTPLGSIIAYQSAESVVTWEQARADMNVSLSLILGMLGELLAEIDTVARGTTSEAVEAEEGDTWESLSGRAYGGPGSARKLREANGASAGSKPIAKKTYIAP